jgi:hypothetical protein
MLLFISASFEWASILNLLRTGRPSAIRWLIIAIIIDAIYRQFWTRTPAHISQEIAKIFPSFTNTDSSASPVSPFRILGIRAALNHSSPNIIFCGSFFPSIFSMLEIPISMMTATTAGSSASIFSREIIAKKHFFYSAVASAKPSRATFADFRCSANNQEPVKSLARPINKCIRHAVIIPLPAWQGEL